TERRIRDAGIVVAHVAVVARWHADEIQLPGDRRPVVRGQDRLEVLRDHRPCARHRRRPRRGRTRSAEAVAVTMESLESAPAISQSDGQSRTTKPISRYQGILHRL